MNRSDFPIFDYQPDLVYLDSANTTLKPRAVIDAVRNYYENYSANIGRATYDLAERATLEFNSVRQKVADFVGADLREVIFTHSATYGINQVAFGLRDFLRVGDVILLTEYEHNSNIIAWQKVAAETGARVVFLDEKPDLENVKIFAFSHVSNITGEVFDYDEITAKVHENGGLVLADITQSIGRTKTNLKNYDFAVFSSHKIYGPSGVGVLFAHREVQEKINPLIFGSQTFKKISRENVILADNFSRFEAGTPNIEGVIGLGAAIDFLNKISMNKISEHDIELTKYMTKQLEKNGLMQFLIGAPTTGIFSLNHPKIHPHDFAMLLNQQKIAVRAGRSCSDILMQKLGLDRGVVRASFGIYTTKTDVDKFIAGYKNAIERLAD
ncbi:MAG: aminotransferase class V-fold PLP-dependent enzyme [Candidatus Nomurabacteria bacterium]|jgi:cysteine desulfurase/selenocysteine lyase|nr:aminotransferase class V-fold PLP-dependent enzyme [Candidatus Nomurabacteria bacterium]